jgi:tryptophan-rich sensory protein
MNITKALPHILLPIIAAVIINVIIYTQKWNDRPQPQPDKNVSKLLPPGYAIAIIWIFILGLLGFTHYLLYPSNISYFIVAIILYCLAYPFLTAGLDASKSGIYNIIAFVLAIALTTSVYMQKKSKDPTVFTLPFLIWTGYVAGITLQTRTS